MKKRTTNIFKTALKVWGRLILAGVMCAVLFISMSVLGSGLLANEVGYQIVEITGTEEAPQTKLIKEHYYAVGEEPVKDLELPENQQILKIREMTPAVRNTLDVITLLFMLFLLCVFPYNLLWELGCKDDNRVRYRNMQPDLLRGLKVGLLAVIPSALLYVGLILSKLSVLPEVYVALYRVLNIPFLPLINWLLPTTVKIADAAFWRVLVVGVTLLLVPVVCWGAYRLGYAQFSVREHMTYKLPKKEKNQHGEI